MDIASQPEKEVYERAIAVATKSKQDNLRCGRMETIADLDKIIAICRERVLAIDPKYP